MLELLRKLHDPDAVFTQDEVTYLKEFRNPGALPGPAKRALFRMTTHTAEENFLLCLTVAVECKDPVLLREWQTYAYTPVMHVLYRGEKYLKHLALNFAQAGAAGWIEGMNAIWDVAKHHDPQNYHHRLLTTAPVDDGFGRFEPSAWHAAAAAGQHEALAHLLALNKISGILDNPFAAILQNAVKSKDTPTIRLVLETLFRDNPKSLQTKLSHSPDYFSLVSLAESEGHEALTWFFDFVWKKPNGPENVSKILRHGDFGLFNKVCESGSMDSVRMLFDYARKSKDVSLAKNMLAQPFRNNLTKIIAKNQSAVLDFLFEQVKTYKLPQSAIPSSINLTGVRNENVLAMAAAKLPPHLRSRVMWPRGHGNVVLDTAPGLTPAPSRSYRLAEQ